MAEGNKAKAKRRLGPLADWGCAAALAVWDGTEDAVAGAEAQALFLELRVVSLLRARRFNAYKMIYTPLAKNNTRARWKNC